MVGPSRAANAAYLSLLSSGGGESSPILFGSNPMGNALLSTGLLALAGSAATAMVPVLPVRVAGIDVREALRRLDAQARPPTPERGVTAANRIGEPLGFLTLRWLVAPDLFEATASVAPPNTELDPSRSQRFVMQEGVLRFEDRTKSGARFFGAGRTYPLNAGGSARLLFAGAAVVVQGLGGLKGLRGSLSLIGEISGRSIVSLVITGRFDDDGPLEVAERLGLMIDSADEGPDATVLTLAAESDGAAGSGQLEELVRVARIDNDLANASQPRSVFRTGETVGRAIGPLRFDPSDRRCAIRLIDARRELTFSDGAGQPVGAIVADGLEGTAYRDQHAGDHVSRVIAYGQLSAGAGALADAGGILTMDTAVSTGGVANTIYTLWLIDERRRFRAPDPPAVTASTAPASAQAIQFVDASAGSMLPADLAILAHVERTLVQGAEINQWFREKGRTADYRERFEIVREHTSDDESFGFFDVAPVGGSQVPVMGLVQEMFYDRQKLGSPEPIREQLEEFVLRYFMRVCHVGEPEAASAREAASESALRRAMSWLPGEAPPDTGPGYQQLYYRLAGAGPVGKFTKDERTAIVDLREIGTKYDWILLKGDMLSFDFPFVPFGTETSMRPLPSKEPTYLLIAPAFVINGDTPEPGVLGEYGFACAFVPYASAGLLAYGPGRFRAAVQRVSFTLMADGEIRARTQFVATRPDKIAAVDVDPIGWSVQLADLVTFRMASRLMSPLLAMADRLPLHARDFDPVAAYIWMANAVTAGMAENYLGISKFALEKRMLFQQLKADQEMLHRSLRVWRMVPDWTAPGKLPDFCHRGI